MSVLDLHQIAERQRRLFLTGVTREVSFREKQLHKLREVVLRDEEKIFAALRADLGKDKVPAYLGEVGVLLGEISHTLKHLRKWVLPKAVSTPLVLMPSRSQICYDPLGVVLIIAPWNYPLQLALSPLVGAIAAGNCAVIKPSELAPATSAVIKSLVEDTFDPGYVAVVEGAVEETQGLLAQRWDHIFYTGGAVVGRVILEAAAKHLTPVTLELGGKSPCIVDETADISSTAKRIVWGKFLNAGQTCVAPDYLFVEKSVAGALRDALKSSVRDFLGADPEQSPDYGRIVSDRHFKRLVSYLSSGTVVWGGQANEKSRYLAPTLLHPKSFDVPVMREEIFGPILPLLEYGSFDEVVHFIRDRDKPLALYLFSRDGKRQKQVVEELSFGGGCLNDTLVHLGNPELPFGGVGMSGMGAYHGKFSFETFSHRKAILKRSLWWDPRFRFPPYAGRLGLLKKLIR